MSFTGMIVASITPFTTSGDIDFQALKEHTEWLIAQGVDGIVSCGTTGETPTLSEEEFLEVVKTVAKTARGRVPILAGTGTNDTRKTVERTHKVKQWGVDGVLVIVPYYNRPSFEGCIQHFREVAKCGLPIMAYHHPGRTGVKLSAAMWAEVLSIPQVVGLKEGSGDSELVRELLPLTQKPILSGEDGKTLSLMQIGSAGIISVVGNLIPRDWKEMVTSIASSDVERAFALHHQYVNLCESLFIESNPQGIKYALSLMNKCTSTMRLPLVEPRESTKQAIVVELIRAGLIPQQKGTEALNLECFLKEDPLPL